MQANIRGIIIDVDGVIVGEKQGVNFPDPNPAVIERLKSIRAKGIPITLCTAKPHAAIQKVVVDAGLNNLHITQGGGVVIDPLDNVILKAHGIDKETAKHILRICLDRGTYVEFYSPEAYFLQASQKSDITPLHTSILGFEPTIVDSLIDEAEKHDIVKIMPIAKDDIDMTELDQLLEPYKSGATVSWGSHPVALPRRFGIITALGISKGQAAAEVAEHEGAKPEELLGIGDSTMDWQFIEHCGYAGAMGNASDELKRLVDTKGDKSFVGDSVDENGILSILDYFGLA
ncbi:MAG TPA: HAD hydrolase family protein [Candidatus Saccharimonadales bacterium]|nr:HAD hydrolase family protein [Candidatus Saccharimonadales bacterium]